MSERKYNLVIGGCLTYGFIMNAIMVMTCGELFSQANPLIFLIGYFACSILGIFLTVSDSPGISFLGYNLVVVPIGSVLSICLPLYNGAAILMAIIATGIAVLIMTSLATAFPTIFTGMGRTLFIALIVSILAELAAIFVFGYTGTIFDWIFVVIFSLYIGYDWCKAQAYPKTLDNAIDSACDLYIDIINLFIRLVEIFGSRN